MSSQVKRLMNCRFPHSEATHRLFCFPWGGGGSNFYAAWGKTMPANIEVYGITLAGRESRIREKPCSSAEMTVAEISAIIALEFGDKPFIFFGHSMGSLLSYETAVLLRKQYGRQPEHIYLSGLSAPHSKSRHELDVCSMTDEDFKAHLRTLGGTPDQILESEEWLQIFLPPLKADYTMMSQIVYEKPEDCSILSCDFTFFDGIDDVDHDYDSWKELTTGTFSLQKLPGHHFYLKEDANQKRILDTIQLNIPRAV